MENLLYIKLNNYEAEYKLTAQCLRSFYFDRNLLTFENNGIPYEIYFENTNIDKRLLLSNIKDNKYCPMSTIDVSFPTTVIVDVLVDDNDYQIDIFSYRYLFLLKNRIMNKNDFLVISCDNIYYNKVASLMFFQNILDNNFFAYDTTNYKIKNFPFQLSVSSEWFPIMSFSRNESGHIFDVLNAPLFKSKNHLANILTEYKRFLEEKSDTDKNTINFKAIYQQIGNNYISDRIRAYLYICVAIWLKDVKEDLIKLIEKHILYMPALSTLLLAIQIKYISKNNSKIINEEVVENLINICCDFSEGILQIIENMICHSEGGCFLFRLNDNLDKIRNEFEFNEISDISNYMRISLLDYSDCGIVENIKKKGNLQADLTLNDIFDFDSNTNEEYDNYISNDNNVVHHYGLQIFRSIILQYKGCFIVKSSSKYTLDSNTTSINQVEDGVKYRKEQQINHIPGTEYDILLPLKSAFYTKNNLDGITSISFNNHIQFSAKKPLIVFEEEIYNFFNTQINVIANNIRPYYKDNMQSFKEATVNESAQELLKCIEKHYKDDAVFYFNIDSNAVQNPRRVEVISKILLKLFSLIKNTSWKLYFVVYGLSEQKVYAFVRQFALFYKKGICSYMKNNQIYVVSDNYKAEILLYGENLKTSYEYLCAERFNYGISANISTIMRHLVSKSKDCLDDNTEMILPFNYNFLDRIERKDEKVILSKKKWYYQKLTTVISNDIHDKYLGCKIPNTHVRVNNVHLDTFYECQLLFGNSFWCQIFAEYIVEKIFENKSIDINAPIILLGYETYTEPLLLLISQKLKSKLSVKVKYLIFENSKYISTTEKSQQKIRYIERLRENVTKDELIKSNVIFINGISTTLSTFKIQLYKEFKNALHNMPKKDFENLNIFAFVVIQVLDSSLSSQKLSDKFIYNDDEFVYSKKGYIDFVKGKKCDYLVSAYATWHEPGTCKLCYPQNPRDEISLVETNETSTVPMVLLKPNNLDSNNFKLQGDEVSRSSFVKNKKNQKFLYYCHLNRSGNHHQYYIRTANFVQEELNSKDSELLKWFHNIKKIESKSQKHNSINIIVSPNHFSNETFVAAVNQYVFSNNAYIINLNVKKEFRDSFEAKFSNYKTMLELIKSEISDITFNINFYFVDDHIVTGATFQRAKSLITGLISKFISPFGESNIKINIFKALIILVNRNSAKSISNYFDISSYDDKISDKGTISLPFYSFIDLKTPSIRSYGDSCPICQKVHRIELLCRESSLYTTEQYWNEKLSYHRVKNLQEAKKEKFDRNQCEDNNFKERGFRRLQCSEELWGCLNHKFETVEDIKNKLQICIINYLKNRNSLEIKIEYLISFIKVMSKPHIIYQENVNTAVLQIILDTYFIFEENFDSAEDEWGKYISNLVLNSPIELKYDLYQVVLARLCSLGSNIFLRDQFLAKSYRKGKQLEHEFIKTKSAMTKEFIPFEDFYRFQLKKNLFSNADSAIKIQKMSDILESELTRLVRGDLDV